MEHIDALEAVRRLTLERDALAEQVRWLKEQAATRIRERDDAVQRANHAENEAERLREENAPQAPVRHERRETGTEPTEGTNGAPRGCMVASRACETCRHWTDNGNDGHTPTGYCHAHPPMANHEAPGALAIYPTTVPEDCCGEWQAGD